MISPYLRRPLRSLEEVTRLAEPEVARADSGKAAGRGSARTGNPPRQQADEGYEAAED